MTTIREAARVDGHRIPAEEAWARDNDAERLAALKAQLSGRNPVTSDPRDAVSETIAMREAGLDVDGEGHGAPRGIQPRPAAQPVGRVNQDGSLIAKG